MAFKIFNLTGLSVGDIGKAVQCTSALFNHQVIGIGATVEFSGSNVPDADINNEAHWIPIVTVSAGVPDSEPFRQHVWDQVRYKITAGTDVAIYVTSGVAG